MPVLSPTQLEKLRWSTQSWTQMIADNMQKLEDNLLYVIALQDVDTAGLSDGDILYWNEGANEWRVKNWKLFWPSTTSTTTTTTTTTTVTTTTT